MALENYLTYDVYDPDDRLTVTANTIAVDGQDSLKYSVHKIFPANTFDGDFEHKVAVKTVHGGSGFASVRGPFWALSNDTASQPQTFYDIQNNNKPSLFVMSRTGAFVGRAIETCEITASSVYFGSSNIDLGEDWLYLEIERDESIGAYGALIVRIYSDAARTTLKDTISQALHVKQDFRTVTAVSCGYNGDNYTYTQDIKDLDLGMGGEEPDTGPPPALWNYYRRKRNG